MRDETSTRLRRPDLTAPEWLFTLARPTPAAIPWPAMVRAGVGLGAPLAIAEAAGRLPVGLFIAMGTLAALTSDRRGPYRVRALQIGGSAVAAAVGFGVGEAVFGRSAGLVLGVLVLVAYLSAMVSAAGTIASTASLQLLIYAVVASGRPFPPPVWEPPLLLAAGGGWALLLTLLGALRDAVSPERRAVAKVIETIADLADAIGTPLAEQRRRDLTDALDTAYDALLSGRVRSGGRSPSFRRFMGLLNATTPVVESTVAAMRADRPVPAELAPGLRAVAAALLARRPLPPLPPLPTVGGAGGPRVGEVAEVAEALRSYDHASVRERLHGWLEEIVSGQTTRLFGIRLALCIGAAEIVRSQLHASRSYWIALTVAIVLKPDFGSVFARAVQRAAGTVLGAVLGAVLVVAIPAGPGFVAAIAVLGALLPMAITRNYGMFSTFVTPIVILLIDLLDPQGWALVQTRLLDTLIGCGIVLVVGYLLWPETFQVRIGPRFVDATEGLSAYARYGLRRGADRGGLRRDAYRRLADLRTVFQQALAEPPPVSERAAAWWPAIVALERLSDAITRAGRRIDRDGPVPTEEEVAAVADGILDLGAAVRARRPPERRPLPHQSVLDDVAVELRTAREVFAGPS